MRLFLVGFIAAIAMHGPVSADDPRPLAAAITLYEGMSYDGALAQFESDLAPSKRTKPLQALISFAIRGHHTEDVARLLIEESKTISPLVIVGFNPTEGQFLRQLLANMSGMMSPEGLASVAGFADFTVEECRYWRVIVLGLLRLSAMEREIFQNAMNNPDYSVTVRCLARMTVDEARFQDEVAKQVSELLTMEAERSASVTPTKP